MIVCQTSRALQRHGPFEYVYYRHLLTSITAPKTSEPEYRQLNSAQWIQMKVNDDFMAPVFLKGDLVVVDPNAKPTYHCNIR